MPRREAKVIIDLLPNLGEQIEDTVEELQGVLFAAAAEFGAVVDVIMTDPNADIEYLYGGEDDREVQSISIRPGALS